MENEQAEFRILDETNEVVAMTAGPYGFAEREIMHYAVQYGQDGPIKVQIKSGRKWKDYLALNPCK